MKTEIKGRGAALLFLACTSCFGALAEHRATHAQLHATNDQAAAQAAANQAAAAAAPPPYSALPVVDAEAAPAPPGGPGWHCYTHARREAGQLEASSRCLRTRDACRAAAADEARREPGLAAEVGACRAQDEATCLYLWSADPKHEGTHVCSAEAQHCQPFIMAPTGAARQQSACAPYR